jgi:hypothetical protein
MKYEYILIHQAIHSPLMPTVVDIGNGITLPIKRNQGNNCRFVTYDNICFMEQNKNKKTSYALQARAGKKITWGIPASGNWVYIDDDTTIKEAIAV